MLTVEVPVWAEYCFRVLAERPSSSSEDPCRRAFLHPAVMSVEIIGDGRQGLSLSGPCGIDLWSLPSLEGCSLADVWPPFQEGARVL